MTGRLYAVTVDAVAVSAAQDIINLTATSGMAFKVRSIFCGQKTLTTAEMKQVRCTRFPATVSAGSGGSAATPRPLRNGDPAATVTARINDTTGMTTSGTEIPVYADVWHFLNGFFWAPEDNGPIVAPSQGFAFELPTAPSGSMTVSATIIFEELF